MYYEMKRHSREVSSFLFSLPSYCTTYYTWLIGSVVVVAVVQARPMNKRAVKCLFWAGANQADLFYSFI